MSDLAARCPDCGHSWAAHSGSCTVNGCGCDGMAALAAVSGIETLLDCDDGWRPVTLIWTAPRAIRMSYALNGKLGGEAHRRAWLFLIRQFEGAKAGELGEGSWTDIGEAPPV